MDFPFVLRRAVALAALLAAASGAVEAATPPPASQSWEGASSGQGGVKIDEEKDRALSTYDKSLQELEKAKAASAAARSEYDKTRAAKRMAAAQDDVSQARKDLMEMGVPVPDRKSTSPDRLKVPDVGPSGALDPNVFQHSWVGEPRAPRRPMERPTVPTGVTETTPMDGGGGGQVSYGRVPEDGIPAIPKGAVGGRMLRGRPGGDAPDGPIDPAPAAPILDEPPVQEPRSRQPRPPRDGPVDDGLPVRRGVDFVSEALPWRPGPWKGLKGGKAVDEELAALARSVQRSLLAGQQARALEDAERLRRLAPADGGVRHLLAMVLNKLERFGEAEAQAREALRLGRDGAEVYETLAWAQLHLGLYEQAADSASRAISLFPEAALAYVIRAHALERLGRGAAGLADIVRASSLRPAQFASMARQAQAGGGISRPSSGASGKGPSPEPVGRLPGGMGMLLVVATAGGAGCLGALALARKNGAKAKKQGNGSGNNDNGKVSPG